MSLSSYSRKHLPPARPYLVLPTPVIIYQNNDTLYWLYLLIDLPLHFSLQHPGRAESESVSNSVVTPWTAVRQAPLSMAFSRQECRSGIPFSRGSSPPRDWTQVSCTAGRFFTIWATREAQGRAEGVFYSPLHLHSAWAFIQRACNKHLWNTC